MGELVRSVPKRLFEIVLALRHYNFDLLRDDDSLPHFQRHYGLLKSLQFIELNRNSSAKCVCHIHVVIFISLSSCRAECIGITREIV